MKKIILLLLVLFVFTMPVNANESENNNEINVFIDGLIVEFEVEPIIQEGRTMVPYRAIAEAMNAEVDWNLDNRTVISKKDSLTIELTIDILTAQINNQAIELDAAPIVINDRTLIPLRFFTEAFDCKVTWNEEEREVTINTPPKDMNVIGFYALGDRSTSSWTNLFGVEYPNTEPGNTDVVNELALGWYGFNEEGDLLTLTRTGWQRPSGWERVLEVSEKYELRTEMVIHETNRDNLITNLLEDEKAANNLINEILEEAVLYEGVNLNLEGLGLNKTEEELKYIQGKFNKFVKKISQELQNNNKTLTLTIHSPNSSYKGYDYKELGVLADRIVIMAYDYGPRPEPNDKVIEAVKIAKSHIPEDKLYLGISAPSETSESFSNKISIAKRHNVHGIALWRLGLITSDMWEVIRTN